MIHIFNDKIDYVNIVIIFRNLNNMTDFVYQFIYSLLNSIFYYHSILLKYYELDFMTFPYDIFLHDLNYSPLIHKIYYIFINKYIKYVFLRYVVI